MLFSTMVGSSNSCSAPPTCVGCPLQLQASSTHTLPYVPSPVSNTAEDGEAEGSIVLTFKSDNAAVAFANEVQAGDVLAPGVLKEFGANQVDFHHLSSRFLVSKARWSCALSRHMHTDQLQGTDSFQETTYNLLNCTSPWFGCLQE